MVCPECDGQITSDVEHGETTYSECGLVVDEDMIDRGPEWRAFGDRERVERSRVGAPTTELRHDNGLSTMIGWRDKDTHGNQLSSEKRKQIQRLRTWDKRFATKNAQERNLKHAFGEIDRMASALVIPKSCRETVGVIYRRAVEHELLPGRSIEGMSTASLYAAARQHGTPRTLVEFETVSRVKKVRIQRAYRYLSQELGLQLEPADPLQYVSQFASALDVSGEAEQLTRELVEAAKAEAIHSGQSLASIAAAALYAAARLSNEQITQDQYFTKPLS
ncbi:TFIIB-type zinc ribbon-containing protein [Natrinema sp. 1APR25-10V2]|uniref:transcription initiation factor IIB n=1 Tax=Natrinema sp. 1APR25-10V2 TaxID=2951081 RepID=UPI0028748CE7|nr:TFIIB-type zinc ribbon-containing protein [Natrinema sp. 1APR25-10V2]MDS0478402.1 transcription initiation factor IIB 2 [Natrinema sp. 1APR25-10V2]